MDASLGFGYRECVLDPLLEWLEAGECATLVTVVGIDGGSPRPLGSQMIVREDGETVGLVTGGCAEQAILEEARDTLSSGTPRQVRYGAGSPYRDIELPCGSGLDLRFDPFVSSLHIKCLIAARDEGRPAGLWLPEGNAEAAVLVGDAAPGPQPSAQPGGFWRPYAPALSLVIAGRGPICSALAAQARAAGLTVTVASPDAQVVCAARALGCRSENLKLPGDFDPSCISSSSALVLIFHDHEWEPEILMAAMQRQPFYVGALGSRATHRRRLHILMERGMPAALRARVQGPVGQAIGAQGPYEIAISVMADLVAARRMHGLPPL